MSGDIRLLLDDEDMAKYLAGLDEKGVVKILRGASTRAGTVLRNAMRPEIPVKKRAGSGAGGAYIQRGIAKNYGTPGGMQASVKARRIKGNEAIGVVVGPMGKAAFMRHWIAYGTKPHEIRPKGIGGFLRVGGGFVSLVHHPGSKPNDYAGRADSKAGEAAANKAEDYLWKEALK
jgi:hypothetical protein